MVLGWRGTAVCHRLYCIFLTYQVGTLITTGSFGAGFLPGLMVVAILAAIVISMIRNSGKHLAADYALSGRK